MEIAAILIALAAVGIACWALGEARRDDIEERLVQAEVAYMAHADNLTKKARAPMVNDMVIEGLAKDLHGCQRNLESLKRLLRDTTTEHRRRFDAIEDYWGVDFRLTLTPAQPERVFFKVEKRSDDGNSSEASN